MSRSPSAWTPASNRDLLDSRRRPDHDRVPTPSTTNSPAGGSPARRSPRFPSSPSPHRRRPTTCSDDWWCAGSPTSTPASRTGNRPCSTPGGSTGSSPPPPPPPPKKTTTWPQTRPIAATRSSLHASRFASASTPRSPFGCPPASPEGRNQAAAGLKPSTQSLSGSDRTLKCGGRLHDGAGYLRESSSRDGVCLRRTWGKGCGGASKPAPLDTPRGATSGVPWRGRGWRSP